MRSYTRIAACCITTLILLVLVLPVSGINITYQVSGDGNQYHAVAVLNDTARYDFVQSGMLGERVPLEVTNITLVSRDGENVSFITEREGIRFNSSNYTLMFDGPLKDHSFQSQFPEPGTISIVLPENYKVDNPLLASIQPGGAVINRSNNQTIITWDKSRYFDIRFYDGGQENLLGIFAQFWLIIAVMLLLPFLFSRGK